MTMWANGSIGMVYNHLLSTNPAIYIPSGSDQRRAIPSALPVNTDLPSGEKVTLITGAVWPVKATRGVPVAISHSNTRVSSSPLTAYLPSGENATVSTSWVCPLNSRTGAPVARSQSRTVRSPLAVRINVPSAENVTSSTEMVLVSWTHPVSWILPGGVQWPNPNARTRRNSNAMRLP